MREWSFRVEGSTAPGEVLCVIGSCLELGEWKPEDVVPMQIVGSTALDSIELMNTSFGEPAVPQFIGKSEMFHLQGDNTSTACPANRNLT